MHTINFFIIIAAVIFIISLTFYLERRRSDSNWTGLIQAKRVEDFYYKGQYHNVYIIYILKDNGEKLTFGVDVTVFTELTVGDRVRKDKGQYYPTRTI